MKISQTLLDQLANRGCGAPVLTCYCNRVHVAVDSGDIEPDDLKRYKDAAAAPVALGRPVLHDNVDSIAGYEFMGNVIVDGCSCDFLASFETLLVQERELILSYYKASARQTKARAEATAAALAAIEEAA